MSSYPSPNEIISGTFNSNFFNNNGSSLTVADADLRYLRLTGGTVSNLNITGTLTIGGSTIDTSGFVYLSGITPGTATASKALILDASKGITGITTLSATNLTGTITSSSASQPNITSLGTLTGITCSGNISGTLT